MSAYFIVDIDVTDPEAYENYRSQVPPLVAKYGGKYLVRGGAFEVLEGDWTPHRLVVLEFPTVQAAKEFYDSEEYEPLKKIRLGATNSSAVLVEGA
ncbi:MAG: D-fructose-6-phosphate amidotransferase [SAR202 cluster bacterium Io17-Chloro-G2]|nr:MAG: D-fructose-6-phosphate amidotransferase [SAR202 cluster bacterium Io17-Chloro-G2]